MKRRIQTHNLVFFALLALMIVIIVISLAGAISWLNRPFAGFLVYKDLYVSVSGQTDWPGPEAGLKFRDRIVAVDGQPVQEANQFVNIIKEKQPGTPVRYLIDTDGEKREVDLILIDTENESPGYPDHIEVQMGHAITRKIPVRTIRSPFQREHLLNLATPLLNPTTT